MVLVLHREDLKREHESLDFDKVEFKHFKAYARNAARHYVAIKFQDRIEQREKEIRPSKLKLSK